MRRLILMSCVVSLAWPATLPAGSAPPAQDTVPSASATELRPTTHPPLPLDASSYWLVPPPSWKPGTAAQRAAASNLGRAASLIADDKPAQALALINRSALSSTPLRDHAIYIKGLADLKAGRFDEARRAFASLRTGQSSGGLGERVTLREAEAAEGAGDFAAAAALYETLAAPIVAAGDEVLLKLAGAAASAGDTARETKAWQRLYFEYAATDAGSTAAGKLASARAAPPGSGTDRFDAELERAERLFSARRHALARDGFERLLPRAEGDQRELIALRLAECDYFLRRYRAAADRARPFIDTASRRAEALYFYLSSVRGLGNHTAYVSMAWRIVREYPESSWAEDALDALASHYIVLNEDEQADAILRELLMRYPASRHAPRAGWKVGWWAYKHGRYAEAAETFERSAAGFPRSDYRPPWLYWAGRARERVSGPQAALSLYRLAVVDYANSYYGRLSAARLKTLKAAPPAAADVSPSRWRPAPTDPMPAAVHPGVPTELIAWLIHAGLYDEALDEVTWAQRTGPRTPALDATRAWLLNRKGELRPGIGAMRQTYPHFLAAGGESLPVEIQRVIFPLDHWPLIKQYASTHKLDPYLVAALIAQESTFDAEIRSSANAIGLMQILPSTGRRWARKLGIRGFSTSRLTNPTINVRIGTAYFADQIRRFGTVHYALAGYNAGDSRVARWIRERPGLAREEFIDDIPFPETQNYVKRILGTAEDYRRLYGGTAAVR